MNQNKPNIEATPWFQVTDKAYSEFYRFKGKFYRAEACVMKPSTSSGYVVLYWILEDKIEYICPSMLTFYSDEEMLLK